nr:hypothetical protein LOC_Os11g01118 [Oryza sativa Japonica Group]
MADRWAEVAPTWRHVGADTGWHRGATWMAQIAPKGDQAATASGRRQMRRRPRVRSGGGDSVADWGNGAKAGMRRGAAELVVAAARAAVVCGRSSAEGGGDGG